MLLLKNGQVFNTEKGFEKKDILVGNGRILNIDESISDNSAEILDASHCYVVPGFIDIHMHGSNGHDTMSATYESLDSISAFCASKGVTSFLPTTVTAPINAIAEALENVGKAMRRGTCGAKILGINLEGPFINSKYKGAHLEQYIIYPSIGLIKRCIEKSGNNIRMMTLAPELEGAGEVLEYFKNHKITFSIGHSSLDYENAIKTFDKGINHVAHLFNCMMGIHHRGPGLAGAAIDSENATVEIIADGIHLSPAVIRLVTKCKSAEKIALVTDSTMAAGLPDGEYTLGDQQITVINKEARLKNGVLAGSTLTMIDAVKNMHNRFGISLSDTIKMATIAPAKILGIDDKRGSISVGKHADIVLLDNDLNVLLTMVDGKVVFKY